MGLGIYKKVPKTILDGYINSIVSTLANNVLSIILFGSVARTEASEESIENFRPLW